MRRWVVPIACAALMLAAFSLLASVVLWTRAASDTDRIEAEATVRRDQNCIITERQQAREVRQLEGTYEYLLKQPRRELLHPGSLPREVFIRLPLTEEVAHEDDAPPYCDEPNIGLPEPDLKVPERPRALRRP